jgi:hypothetical protein
VRVEINPRNEAGIVEDAVCAGCVVFLPKEDPDADDEVVLIHGHPEDGDFCSPPKGMLDSKKRQVRDLEKFCKNAAITETRQETGHLVEGNLEFVGCTSYPRLINNHNTHKTVRWYWAMARSRTPELPKDGECCWVGPARLLIALASITYPDEREIVFKAFQQKYQSSE